MGRSIEQEERERICLKEHDRLAELFQKDRLSFERERKRLIEDIIAAAPGEKYRANLTLMQLRVDKILGAAGSQHNRFVMMQTLFWDHIVNVWIPALNRCTQGFDDCDLPVQTVTNSRLSLVEKRIKIEKEI
jgi:uncharacterized protein DUF3135